MSNGLLPDPDVINPAVPFKGSYGNIVTKQSKSAFLAQQQRVLGEQVGDDVRGIGKFDLYTPFGTSQYDEGLIQGVSQYAQRASRQSNWDRVGNAAAKTIPAIGLGILENAGYLGELVSYLDPNAEKDFTNGLVEWAIKKKEGLNESNPNYIRNPHLTGLETLTDPTWWIEYGQGLVESVGEFLVTGAGVGSALGKGSKALNLIIRSNLVRSGVTATAQLGTAASLAYTEGAMSGARLYKEIYDAEMGLHGNHDQAKAKAASGAVHTVKLNTALNTGLNLTSVSPLFKTLNGIKSTAREAVRNVAKEGPEAYLKALGEVSKKGVKQPSLRKVLGYEALQEGLEEDVNLFAEQEGRIKGGLAKADTFSSPVDRFLSSTFSSEGALNALLGGIGGMGQTLGVQLIPYHNYVDPKTGETKRVNARTLQKLGEQGAMDNYISALKTDLTYLIKNQKGLQKAVDENNKEKIEEHRNNLFNIGALKSIREGIADEFADEIRGYAAIDNTKVSEEDGMTDAMRRGFADSVNDNKYKETAIKKANDILKLTDEYENLENQFQGNTFALHQAFRKRMDIYSATELFTSIENATTEAEANIQNTLVVDKDNYSLIQAMGMREGLELIEETPSNKAELTALKDKYDSIIAQNSQEARSSLFSTSKTNKQLATDNRTAITAIANLYYPYHLSQFRVKEMKTEYADALKNKKDFVAKSDKLKSDILKEVEKGKEAVDVKKSKAKEKKESAEASEETKAKKETAEKEAKAKKEAKKKEPVQQEEKKQSFEEESKAETKVDGGNSVGGENNDGTVFKSTTKEKDGLLVTNYEGYRKADNKQLSLSGRKLTKERFLSEYKVDEDALDLLDGVEQVVVREIRDKNGKLGISVRLKFEDGWMDAEIKAETKVDGGVGGEVELTREQEIAKDGLLAIDELRELHKNGEIENLPKDEDRMIALADRARGRLDDFGERIVGDIDIWSEKGLNDAEQQLKNVLGEQSLTEQPKPVGSSQIELVDNLALRGVNYYGKTREEKNEEEEDINQTVASNTNEDNGMNGFHNKIQYKAQEQDETGATKNPERVDNYTENHSPSINEGTEVVLKLEENVDALLKELTLLEFEQESAVEEEFTPNIIIANNWIRIKTSEAERETGGKVATRGGDINSSLTSNKGVGTERAAEMYFQEEWNLDLSDIRDIIIDILRAGSLTAYKQSLRGTLRTKTEVKERIAAIKRMLDSVGTPDIVEGEQLPIITPKDAIIAIYAGDTLIGYVGRAHGDLGDLIRVRKHVIANGQVTTKIAKKDVGVLRRVDERLSVSEAMPDVTDFVVGHNGAFEIDMDINYPLPLINKNSPRSGFVYAVVNTPNGAKMAIPVDMVKVDQSMVDSMMNAIELYTAANTSTGNTLTEEDTAIVKQIFDVYEYDLTDIRGLWSYLNEIIYLSDLSNDEHNTLKLMQINDRVGKGVHYIDVSGTGVRYTKDGAVAKNKKTGELMVKEVGKNTPAIDVEGALKTLRTYIKESYSRVDITRLADNREYKVPVIEKGEDGLILTEKYEKNYSEYIKSVTITNIKGFPLADGSYSYFLQPKMYFDTSFLSGVDPKKVDDVESTEKKAVIAPSKGGLRGTRISTLGTNKDSNITPDDAKDHENYCT